MATFAVMRIETYEVHYLCEADSKEEAMEIARKRHGGLADKEIGRRTAFYALKAEEAGKWGEKP